LRTVDPEAELVEIPINIEINYQEYERAVFSVTPKQTAT